VDDTPRKSRILWLDDQEVLGRLATEILEKNGYAAKAVYTSAQALKVLESESFDAIIMDQNRPGDIHGDAFARALRDRWYNKPLLCATGHPNDVRDRASFDRIIAKTELFPEVLEALRGLLSK